jgi:hypothetical protein
MVYHLSTLTQHKRKSYATAHTSPFHLACGHLCAFVHHRHSGIRRRIVPNPTSKHSTRTPLTQEGLEQFWQEMYPSAQPLSIASHTNVYTTELLAKASPDECFNGIGVPMTNMAGSCLWVRWIGDI